MRVVICGGGVIGAAAAYFLGLRGVEAIVVERVGVASAASGKSGGFLALDWCAGTPVDALARRSFALHAELAARLGGEAWGYRRMEAYAVLASARRDLSRHRGAEAPAWLGPETATQARIGTPESTAQVHPARFTETMLRAAEANGARLRKGVVTGFSFAPGGNRVDAALVDGEPMPCDAALIAMGPWSAQACGWFRLPAIHGLKGHSLVLRTGDAIPPQALFVEYEAEDGRVTSPEVFPRPDGTTYVCGLPGEAPVPADPAAVGVEPGAEAALRALARRLAPGLGGAEVLAVQACYRPIARDGLPVMGRIPGVGNAYIATGHSVWGILNAPASGEAMAELIVDGGTALDLRPFDPARLPPLAAS
jgi:glycine/D-amino acid oxidase-like deaminating enzyme